MAGLVKKWLELHMGWKLYSVGCALICGPIWADWGLSSASIVLGGCFICGAFFYAAGTGQ